MVKKKRKPGLPRITVLALSRQELTRFVDSIQRLSTLSFDLAVLVANIRDCLERLEKRTRIRRKTPDDVCSSTDESAASSESEPTRSVSDDRNGTR
jgi:hypothetical protein